MSNSKMHFACAAVLAAATLATAPTRAATLVPLSYAMINGGGQASGGSFNYWDATYSGSGATTTDGAALSGGLGKLTDGVIATQRWDAVSNVAGTGQYVGWLSPNQSNPVITFDFAAGTVIDTIDIWVDNSQFGGVFGPSAVLIDGVGRSFSAAVGNGIQLSFTGLNLVGTSHMVQLQQAAAGTWVFVSEIAFNGSTAVVPEPHPVVLTGLGLACLAAARRRFRDR